MGFRLETKFSDDLFEFTGIGTASHGEVGFSSFAAVPGSTKRVLTYINGIATWEGEDIDPNEAIPD